MPSAKKVNKNELGPKSEGHDLFQGAELAPGFIGFQIMILARPEGGIRVRRAYKYVVEDSDR
jgi:hypothetical protein